MAHTINKNKKKDISLQDSPKETFPYLEVLCGICIIGCILRFYQLGYNSLWLDEAYTYSLSTESYGGIWQAITSGEVNPPLFYWLEHIILYFGNSEIILRAIPAISGVILIPVMYFLGKEIFDKRAGLISAMFTASSPIFIYYSQEARAYMLATLLLAIAILYYIKFDKSNTIKDAIIFGIFAALTIWTHLYTIIIIAILCGIYLIKIIKNYPNKTPIGLIVCGVLCAPLITILPKIIHDKTASAPTFGLQGTSLVIATLSQFVNSNIIVFLVIGFLTVIGIIQLYKNNKFKYIFLFALITIATILCSVVISYKMPILPRYLIFLGIPLYLIISPAYAQFKSFGSNKITCCFLAICIIVASPMLFTYYTGYSKDDWRGVANIMSSSAHPGDQIVLIPSYMVLPFEYYYSNETKGTILLSATTVEELNKIISIPVTTPNSHSDTYFIMTSDIIAANPNGGVIEWFRANATYHGQVGGIYLFSSG